MWCYVEFEVGFLVYCFVCVGCGYGGNCCWYGGGIGEGLGENIVVIFWIL